MDSREDPGASQRSGIRSNHGKERQVQMKRSRFIRCGARVRWYVAFVLAGLVVAMGGPCLAVQYTAYSLAAARVRVERGGSDWRSKEPEVLNLGGINRVEGFVLDKASGALILVGEHEEGRAALTLDDLVVALRARLRENEWPLVSIDPTPDTPTTKKQHVRWEGGIQGSAFGQTLFDADYRLKELGMGLAETGVAGLQTCWDRDVEECERGGGAGETRIRSRLWFYPITPHVVVREGVCVVRGLRMGVFTEVLSATVNGKAVEDLKAFKSAATEAWARDVNDRFEDLCRTQPSFNRLRGLEELTAVSKAVEEMEERPDLKWWLEEYPLAKVETPTEVPLRVREKEGAGYRLEVSGGVRLTALAMRLSAGDVSALREAVLKTRPGPDALQWSFVAGEWIVPLGAGQVKPEDIALLFQQAVFLQERERHADAVALYDEIIRLDPDYAEAYNNRGIAYRNKGEHDRAIADYDRAIALKPDCAEAYVNRGVAYDVKGEHDRAIADYDRAIALKPDYALAYFNRGNAYDDKGDPDRAIADHTKAIALKPDLAEAYYNRGNAYYDKGEHDRAIADCDRAIALKPDYAEAYVNRGAAYLMKGEYDRAIADCDRAIALKPDLAEAYFNRGNAYDDKGEYDRAIADFDRAIALKPDYAEAYYNRGNAYGVNGEDDRAIADYTKAIALKPNYAEAYNNRGIAYRHKGEHDRAIADYTKAIALEPNCAKAYNNRGNAYGQKGEYNRAIADFDRAIALKPDYADAYYNRAVAWYFKKDYDRAWADVKRCREHGGTPNPKLIELLRKASGRSE